MVVPVTSSVPLTVTSLNVEEPLEAVTLPVRSPVTSPATLPVTLPVKLPVTLPVTVPVIPVLAVTVVNVPAAGVAPPMTTPSAVPPLISADAKVA